MIWQQKGFCGRWLSIIDSTQMQHWSIMTQHLEADNSVFTAVVSLKWGDDD